MQEKPTVSALAPWFGSNRMLGHHVGELLKDCKWVGVPFAGGMAELVHIDARTIAVNDLHRHVVNLAMVVAGPNSKALADELDRLPFHPDTLIAAQDHCRWWESQPRFGETPNYAAARSYFICCWMGRSTKAGTDDEFKGNISVRFTSSGGDSNTRYRSAVESLEAWGAIMRRCNFTALDFREFLDKCQDQPEHGIYCDPPFPGPSDKYKHKFTEQDHRDLAAQLSGFTAARVVCRFYDHPFVRELYPAEGWEWLHLDGGRKQSNGAAPEVLLVKRQGGAA